jgi:hypothetical protein
LKKTDHLPYTAGLDIEISGWRDTGRIEQYPVGVLQGIEFPITQRIADMLGKAGSCQQYLIPVPIGCGNEGVMVLDR